MQRAKKILFIDPVLQPGHVNFNNIYIKSLYKARFSIDFIFAEGYEKYLNIDQSRLIYSIPKFLLQNKFGKAGNRIAYLLSLWLIKIKVNFKKYDFVLFSSFEEVSFYCSSINNCYLINHINVSNACDSSFKFFFLNKVISKNTLIVLDEETQKFLKTRGNYKVIVKPHGLARAKKSPELQGVNSEILAKIMGFDKIIFSPSDSSSDKLFLNRLVSDTDFLSFIEKENVLFILKGNISVKNANIFQINHFLDENTYDFLFLKSSIVLIAYAAQFKYRASGVMMEAISNNKPCLISRIKSLQSYSDYFIYNPFYENIEELIEKSRRLLTEGEHNKFYKNLNMLDPDFSNWI